MISNEKYCFYIPSTNQEKTKAQEGFLGLDLVNFFSDPNRLTRLQREDLRQ